MGTPVRIYFDNGDIVLAVRVYYDIRLDDKAAVRELLTAGFCRVQTQSPYSVNGQDVSIRVEIEEADAFSLDAVNVRVYDITPVVRGVLKPGRNTSRAYIGGARAAMNKLTRYILRIPDMYINLAGRDISAGRGADVMKSVVQHEFMHLICFRDKYRGRGEKQKKLNKRVQDRDIMYRTGGAQRLMEYQIKRLLRCAQRGKLPIRPV